MSNKKISKTTLKNQRNAIATFNTVLQTTTLGLLNPNSTPITLITDFIILGAGNFVLTQAADNFSSKMNTSMQQAYLPVTSALYASMYGNLMYDRSWPRLLAFNGFIAGTELYALEKLNTSPV